MSASTGRAPGMGTVAGRGIAGGWGAPGDRSRRCGCPGRGGARPNGGGGGGGGVPGAAAGPGFGSTERSVAAAAPRSEGGGSGLRSAAPFPRPPPPGAVQPRLHPALRRTLLAAGAPSPLEAPSVPSRYPSPRIRRRSARRTAPGSPWDRGITEAGAAPRRGGLRPQPTADARGRRGSLPAPGAAGGAGLGPEPALGEDLSPLRGVKAKGCGPWAG